MIQSVQWPCACPSRTAEVLGACCFAFALCAAKLFVFGFNTELAVRIQVTLPGLAPVLFVHACFD